MAEPTAGTRAANQENVKMLKKGRDVLGELYPILKDGNGEIIDGFHRNLAGFVTEVTLHPKSKFEKDLIRFWANHRRDITKSERKDEVVRLAKDLEKDVPKEEIASTLAKNLPFDESYILKLLPPEYKHENLTEAAKKTPHPKAGLSPAPKSARPSLADEAAVFDEASSKAAIYSVAPSKARQPMVYEFRVRQLKVLVTVKPPYFVPQSALAVDVEDA